MRNISKQFCNAANYVAGSIRPSFCSSVTTELPANSGYVECEQQTRYDKVVYLCLFPLEQKQEVIDESTGQKKLIYVETYAKKNLDHLRAKYSVSSSSEHQENPVLYQHITQNLIVPQSLDPSRPLAQNYRAHFNDLLRKGIINYQFLKTMQQLTSRSKLIILLHGGCFGGGFEDDSRGYISIEKLACFIYFLLNPEGTSSQLDFANPLLITLACCLTAHHFEDVKQSTAAKFHLQLANMGIGLQPLFSKVVAFRRTYLPGSTIGHAGRAGNGNALSPWAMSNLHYDGIFNNQANAYGAKLLFTFEGSELHYQQQVRLVKNTKQDATGRDQFINANSPFTNEDHFLELVKQYVNQELVAIFNQYAGTELYDQIVMPYMEKVSCSSKLSDIKTFLSKLLNQAELPPEKRPLVENLIMQIPVQTANPVEYFLLEPGAAYPRLLLNK